MDKLKEIAPEKSGAIFVCGRCVWLIIKMSKSSKPSLDMVP